MPLDQTGQRVLMFTPGTKLATGESIVATATNLGTGDTSEFSLPFVILDAIRDPGLASNSPELCAIAGVEMQNVVVAFFQDLLTNEPLSSYQASINWGEIGRAHV